MTLPEGWFEEYHACIVGASVCVRTDDYIAVAVEVLGMCDAYHSFQAELVGQVALELACEKTKASAIGSAKV